MSDDDDAMALREIKWKTLVLGQRQPTELTEGQEWTSQSSDKYPIDIVLALDNVCNVYKVIVDVDDFNTPSRVDVSVGLGAVDEEKNYRNARHARFKTGVVLQYKKREKSASRMEMRRVFSEFQQAFTDAFGQYVWLVVHEPIKHRTNPTEIATIHKITVLGYPLTDREKSKIRKKNLGIEDERKSRNSPSAPSQGNEPKPSTPYGTRVGSSSSHRWRDPGDFRSEGIKTTSEGMGGDALSSLRVVRNALAEKMHRSNKIGKTVEASMCKRAIQRLDEYEGKIKDLAVRRNNALVVGDDEMAQRHQLGMQDCRDTAMRTAHVDLLLGRDELKAIGVQSDWTE